MNRLYIRRASELASCSGRTQSAERKWPTSADSRRGSSHGGRPDHRCGRDRQLDRMLGLSEEESHALDRKETEETAWGAALFPLSMPSRKLSSRLVDSHTHFIFGGYRADEFSWRLKGDSYMSIMERGGGINATIELPGLPPRRSSSLPAWIG